ncbi:MAG: hypothetical protein R3F61_22475 [Myxococcota bacterium]
MIGRAEEAARIRAGLTPSEGTAVVAVVGPGGSGKSRLVREVVDGLWCDLSVVSDLRGVVDAVAATLGIPVEGDADPERIGRALSGRAGADGPVILVLDACERAIDAVVACVPRWRGAARLVLTTRVRPPVGLLVEVGPLGLPRTHADAVTCEAGQLFVERARAVRPGWTPEPDELPAIAEVLRRLDGLPLAVGLAAARLRILGTHQLLEHLTERFRLLSGAEGSLQAVLQASWDLLDPEERALVERLAWFRSGFELAAVEALVGDPFTAVDLLQRLVDHSLVRAWEPPGLHGVLWYRMYESVREFAHRQSDVPSCAAWLAERGYALASRSRGPEMVPVLEQLALWRADLEAAFEEGRAHGDGELAGHAALALDPVLKTRGPVRRRREVLRQAVEVGGPLADEVFLTAIDARAVPPDVARLERIAGAEGPVQPWGLRALGRDHGDRCDYPKAVALAAEAVRLQPQEARNHAVHAELLHESGRPLDAVVVYQKGLEVAKAKGEKRYEAGILGFLGILDQELGRGHEARAVTREAVDILRSIGDDRGAALYTITLGELALEGGSGEARACFEQALVGLVAVGEQRWQAFARAGIGMAEAYAGHVEAARAAFLEAVARAREYDEATLCAVVFCWAASFEALHGGLVTAARLVEEARGGDTPRTTASLRAATAALEIGRALEAKAAGDDVGWALHRSAAASLLSHQEGWRTEARVIGRLLEPLVRDAALREVDLTCAVDASWFERPGEERVSLATRAANRRVLARLLEARRTAPGTVVEVSDLVEAGWPGERIVPSAGASRVYTAIATLRRIGLKDLIQKKGKGYLLRPDVVVVRV